MDDAALHAEVIELAQDLIRVDTTNGNETAAATVLRERLAGADVEAELVARDPARANLVARLPGTGDGPTLAFVGHLDVVPADARDWTHPPFGGTVDDDGFLYGRGAVDMKNEVAIRTVAMAALAREGFRPRGDLLLLMVADEEDGAAEVGMQWLVGARPDLRADYRAERGRRRAVRPRRRPDRHRDLGRREGHLSGAGRGAGRGGARLDTVGRSQRGAAAR